MRCRKVRSFLSAYCKGETLPEISAGIKHHLDGCGSCRREENVYRSMSRLVSEMPQLKASEEFTAKLFVRIGQEGFAERRTKAYFPKRIPRFGIGRLATVASTAILVLALGIGFHLGDGFLSPSAPHMAAVQPPDRGSNDDLYLTVQPTDNPLLNKHKSISRVIAQYNRWREYSRSLRDNAGAEHFLGGESNAILASARTGSANGFGIRVRPVVKNYLIVP